KPVVTLQCANCASLTFFDAAIVSGSSGDRVMQRIIKLMNELANAVESGPDSSKLAALSAELQECSEKLKALGLSEAENKQLTLKYKDDLAKASARLSSAALQFEYKDLVGLGKLDLGALLGQVAQKR